MDPNINYFNILFFGLLGGFIPALVWLFFWLREDKKNPEPKRMILLAFIGGLLAVAISLYIEKLAYEINLKHLFSFEAYKNFMSWLQDYARSGDIAFEKLALVSIFAPVIEEVFKYLFAWLLVLRSRYDDEPIDPAIYMITVALGFAALENVIFLLDPLIKHEVVNSVMTGNMRFIGATILHTISSATIGMFIAFNFYDSRFKKFLWTLTGLVCAIITHSVFNFFMVSRSSSTSFMTYSVIWLFAIVLLFMFEKIKTVKIRSTSVNKPKKLPNIAQ